MQLKAQRAARVQLLSGLNAAGSRALPAWNVWNRRNGAVRDSVAASGDNAVAVIPEGPYVVPLHVPRAA